MSFNSFSQHTPSTFSPPPCSQDSSPDANKDANAGSGRGSSGSSSFAFLVHSQDTLTNNLPPSVDNKGLARQRRRRTSPEDQAILEAEFQKNDKPDRETRARLVDLVALGEKEVQIWFQNRRQLAKRRSRPLQPHELFPHLSQPGGASPTPELLAKNDAVMTLERANASLASTADTQSRSSQDASRASVEADIVPSSMDERDEHGPTEAHGDHVDALSSSKSPEPSAPEFCLPQTQESTGQNDDLAEPSQGSTVPFSSQDQGDSPCASQEKSRSGPLNHRRPGMRMSMSSAGVVKVLREDESSPSPPRPHSVDLLNDPTFRSMHKSFRSEGLPDCVERDTVFSASVHSNASLRSGFQRQLSGRSRDSRAWEFWCDAEASKTLNDYAEGEQRGSAADAIRLMRQGSGRRPALTSLLSHENVQVEQHRRSLKRVQSNGGGPHPKRSSLGRASTSTGRLQRPRDSGIGMEIHVDDCEKDLSCKDGNIHAATTSSNGEDKENIDPESGANPARRPVTQSQQQPARRRPKLASSLTAPVARAPKYRGPAALQTLVNVGNSHSWRRPAELSNENDEIVDPENDPEVAMFMRSSKTHPREQSEASSSRSEVDDMDCAQGLLSLSQGNWK